MIDIISIIVILTSIWVLLDAKTIGVEKGQITGMGNMGPWAWFFACFFLWIIAFPFYVAKRPEIKRVNDNKLLEQKTSRTMKKCTQCAEKVMAEAKICKHCGHKFDITPARREFYSPTIDGGK